MSGKKELRLEMKRFRVTKILTKDLYAWSYGGDEKVVESPYFDTVEEMVKDCVEKLDDSLRSGYVSIESHSPRTLTIFLEEYMKVRGNKIEIKATPEMIKDVSTGGM